MDIPGDNEIFSNSSIEGISESRDFSISSNYATIDQRLNNIETTIRDLIPRIITIENCLGIGSKQSKVFTTEAYPEEWSLRRDEDYVNFAKKKILHLRNDISWRQCFAAYQLEGLTDQQRSKIDFILTKGPINVSKIVNSIALILIGAEDIKNYLIGVHGEAVKKSTRVNMDTRPILAIEKESRLRTFFSLIDKVFISPKGWETLVRKPINQMGREFFSGKRKLKSNSGDWTRKKRN
uniref:Uncharacterized protein n=1 Tax=Tetranychus urticae TaxID=32264 RepID=T1L6F1_TETUR